MSWQFPPGYRLVPPEVIAARLERAGQALAARGMAAMLLTQAPDVYYYTGSCQQGVALVRARGTALYFVRRHAGRAAAESPVQVVPVRGLTEAARSLSLQAGDRLGLTLDLLPARAYLDWRRRLTGVELDDVSALVQEQRAIKDDYEIAVMSEAGALAAKVFAEIPRLLGPGVSEAWLAGQLQALAMAGGHIDLLRTRGAFLDTYSWHIVSGPEGAVPSTIDAASLGYGLSPAFPLGASHKQFKPHEPIVVDFGICLCGYQTDQTRTFCLGAAPPALRAAHAGLKAVQEVILEMLRPGAVSGEIFATAVETARAHGLEAGFLGRPEQRTRFCAHGLGLELGVPPYLLEGSRERVRARETYALELKMVLDEGPVGLENTVLVREQGPPAILSPMPDELVEVPL